MSASDALRTDFKLYIRAPHERTLVNCNYAFNFVATGYFLPEADSLVNAVAPHESERWHYDLPFLEESLPFVGVALTQVCDNIIQHHNDHVVVDGESLQLFRVLL